MEKTNVIIYTDGACSGNPGPGGYAAIIMLDNNKKEVVGAERDTTNNRMELRAAIEGLKNLKKPCNVSLYSDSAYLVNAYNNKWIDGWKKKGWKNASGDQVKNIDLWEELEVLRQIHDITFIKVKGHADNEFNNRCDKLAVEAIEKLKKVEQQVDEPSVLKQVFGNLPTLETERLNLRLFRKDDVHDLFEYCSDENVTRYVTFETYTSIKEAENRINYCLENYTKLEEPITWAIEYKEDNKVIGSIDFVKWDDRHKVGEVGYVLNRKYWNRGIATEALSAVLKFGFEKMGLNRIEIHCDIRNIASQRVMEKNGLQYEGTLRQKRLDKGEYISLKSYSILREEYCN